MTLSWTLHSWGCTQTGRHLEALYPKPQAAKALACTALKSQTLNPRSKTPKSLTLNLKLLCSKPPLQSSKPQEACQAWRGERVVFERLPGEFRGLGLQGLGIRVSGFRVWASKAVTASFEFLQGILEGAMRVMDRLQKGPCRLNKLKSLKVLGLARGSYEVFGA